MTIPRCEHPRPDFRRENWLCLNGQWDFSFEKDCFDRKITVPYAPETELSGIADTGFHDLVWYRKRFSLPETMAGKKILLHFGAVDYECDLWVNGHYVRSHEGGQSSFFADITRYLTGDEQEILLKVWDDHADMEMPRGKQYWKLQSEMIFYTRTTGIWQSVWLEAVESLHLTRCRITPLLDEKAVRFDYTLSGKATAEFTVRFAGNAVATACAESDGTDGTVVMALDQRCLAGADVQSYAWSPENPHLFDVTVRILDKNCETDCVESYFGLRKVSIENGKFLLNGKPYYQKLVLDQGYWEKSLMTAPTDEDFIRDIELVKAMGFNGVRKHQKVEDPRFLYHADRLGLLVWGEIGAAHQYSPKAARRMYHEWLEVVERDYNHPCIVVWVPLNENWGVSDLRTDSAQQAHCQALVYMTKSLDTTRPIIDNDGWLHTCGDLLTIHDYATDPEALYSHYMDLAEIMKIKPERREMFADGWHYQGQPILVTEFGGIRFAPDSHTDGAWGYCETKDTQSYARSLAGQVKALLDSPLVQGYCYTQLTDIELEENGLLTYGRQPKLPPETLRAINEGTWNE